MGIEQQGSLSRKKAFPLSAPLNCFPINLPIIQRRGFNPDNSHLLLETVLLRPLLLLPPPPPPAAAASPPLRLSFLLLLSGEALEDISGGLGGGWDTFRTAAAAAAEALEAVAEKEDEEAEREEEVGEWSENPSWLSVLFFLKKSQVSDFFRGNCTVEKYGFTYL